MKQWDLSLGGPIVRNRVWFFGAFRYADLTNGISRTPLNTANITAFAPDFEPFDNYLKSNQPFVKVTAQVTNRHELSAFYQNDRSSTRATASSTTSCISSTRPAAAWPTAR